LTQNFVHVPAGREPLLNIISININIILIIVIIRKIHSIISNFKKLQI